MVGPRKVVKGKDRRSVQSVEVAGKLLLALARHPGLMSLKDLAERSGLTPSRAHPYLVSFAKLGFVVQHDGNGHYRLGSSALELGLSCLHQSEPLQVAGPVAENLARQSRQGVSVAVWGNMGPTIVQLIEPQISQYYAMREGTVVPLFTSATGRAFAAVVSNEQAAEALQRSEGKTPPPHPRPSSAQQLELMQVRAELLRHGLCRVKGSFIAGINAYGAPIFDHRGKPVLVIALHGHESHVTGGWNSAHAQALRNAAWEVTRMLGGGLGP